MTRSSTGFEGRLVRTIVCALACASASCDRGGPSSSAEAGRTPRVVAVVPKGTTHVFWKAVERGAREAGSELGMEILWKGPLVENDRAQQIQIVQQLIARRVDGIVLAPLDRAALVQPVAEARSAGIPVVVFDSALEGEVGKDFAAFVATDNEAAGRLAGERLRDTLDAGAGVVLLRYLVGSASTESREAGCLQVLRREPSLEILVDNRYAGATAGEAKAEALQLGERLRRAQGIFCSNESATLGMLLALRQLNLAGRVLLVGFDASPPLLEALRAGEIDALVVQDPRRMGRVAVETLGAALRGEKHERSIDTGAVLVTRENLDQPAIRKLLE
jgi:ribose transport system substrate-binding protein